MPRSAPSQRELAGRVALVTGAGVRVGRAIAEELGRAGAAVAVHHAQSVAGAQATAAAIRRSGSHAQVFGADLRHPAAARILTRDVIRWGGRLDILVNSAAAFERVPIDGLGDERWEAMLALNLTAPFRLARMAAAELRRRRGVVVNILDVAAFAAWPGYVHYCVSKAGLAMLTRCLALELAPNARACAVAPGTVLFPRAYDASARSRVLGRIPLRRIGSPADVARAVRFLAGADYTTGSTLVVDGGRMTGMPADVI